MFRFLIFLLLFCSQIALAEKVQVQSIADGDTIRIWHHGDSELVRFIGMDAPERHDNEKAYQMAKRSGFDIKTILDLGERAANFLKTKIRKGDTVELEYDVEERDKYGRLLAYVYTEKGEMLNAAILDQGFAHLLTMPPNIKYVEKLKAAYQNAKDLKRGLWSFEPFRDGERKDNKKKKWYWK